MKVSVHMITYNHERFLERALDSVLAQQTGFPFEVVVSDDASTDGTSSIVRRYAERHPQTIRPLMRERNVGMNRNYIETLRACRGEYVAFLEGDDYWLSPRKLQTQVDVLDAHPEAVMCVHPVRVVAGEEETELFVTAADPRDAISIEDVILYRHPLPTCGTLLRNVLGELPPWFERIHNLDYATQILAARHGAVRILHEPMAVYRRHGGGLSQTTALATRIDMLIDLLHSANAELGFAYDRTFRTRLAAMYRDKTKVELQRYRVGAAARAAWQYAAYRMTAD